MALGNGTNDQLIALTRVQERTNHNTEEIQEVKQTVSALNEGVGEVKQLTNDQQVELEQIRGDVSFLRSHAATVDENLRIHSETVVKNQETQNTKMDLLQSESARTKEELGKTSTKLNVILGIMGSTGAILLAAVVKFIFFGL